MKTSIFRLLNLLALISLFAFGSPGRVKAHDFPFAAPLEKTYVSNCIDAQATPSVPAAAAKVAVPLGSSSLALCGSYTSLIALPTRPSEVVSELAGRWAASWKAAPAPAELSLARPDEGVAPSPRLAARPSVTRPYAKKQYLEDYMPYDFAVRDWRFHQVFSQQQRLPLAPAALGPQAPSTPAVAQVAPAAASPELQVIAVWLERFEQWQCAAYSNLHDLAVLENSSYELTGQVLAAHQLATGELLAGWNQVMQPARKPLFTEPQFVIFESPIAQPTVVVPVEQGRHWNLLQASPSDLAQASLAPVGKRLISNLSNQLENTGHAMLFLSRYVGQIGEPKVAARAAEAIR